MDDFQIIVVCPADEFYINQCIEIARENHSMYGGFIPYLYAVKKSCDYIICAIKNEKVLGYVGVNFNRVLKEYIIPQVAVKKIEAGKGIGTKLMNYLKNHSLEAKKILSFVEKSNEPSNKMHLKVGFKKVEEYYDYYYELNTSEVKNNQYLKYSLAEAERE